MASIFADFHEAQRIGAGQVLASCLAPIDTPGNQRRLESFAQLSNYHTINADVRYHVLQDKSIAVKLPKAEGNAWVEIFVALWMSVKELLAVEDNLADTSWSKTFDAYKEVCNLLIRGYSNHGFQAWTVPCLYTTGKYLRIFAMRADAEAKSRDTNGFGDGFSDDVIGNFGKNEKLEQAAWVINRMFTICLSDRADLHESRKWGIYSTTNLLFKTYFKLNSVGLCKNVLRAIAASEAEIPSLDRFPRSHRVTFKYYRGVIAFLDENYTEAESHLTEALELCHKDATRNQEQILTYLIPAHLLTTHTLPTPALLSSYPSLQTLLSSLCKAIRSGSLSAFDHALAEAEHELVRRRIYLTLERGRDICLRNLVRKVFLAGGFEPAKEDDGVPTRRTRIQISEFEVAFRIGGVRGPEGEFMDADEVECLLAGLIYKNLMKGYIARERSTVVLSKAGAFPGTGV
jgi:COP9 signalosome complex subunit 12